MTIDAGIQTLADTLCSRTHVGGDDRQDRRDGVSAEAQVVTCLITAAAHRAAMKTMKQHRIRSEPCPRPKKRISVGEARNRHSGDGGLMWERITKLRSTGKSAAVSRSSVPSMQVEGGWSHQDTLWDLQLATRAQETCSKRLRTQHGRRHFRCRVRTVYRQAWCR